MEPQLICPRCKGNTSASDYYCLNCGKKLKDKPPSTSILTQILVYLLSFFLAPLGIWPAIKYLRQPDKKSKYIGWAAIIITVVSIVVMVWITFSFMGSVGKEINQQIDLYQNLNF